MYVPTHLPELQRSRERGAAVWCHVMVPPSVCRIISRQDCLGEKEKFDKWKFTGAKGETKLGKDFGPND